MIDRSLATSTFYRVHSPRWAKSPLSGAGAARQGGRFNRPGVHALYLSVDSATALAEYQQDELLLPPGTLVTYRVTLQRIVDLSAGYQPEVWAAPWAAWDCDWRALRFSAGIDPQSWALGDVALAAGASGILFPSLRRTEADSLNLVVYVQRLGIGDDLTVHDPKGALK